MDISSGYATKWEEFEKTKIKIQFLPEVLRAEMEDKHTTNKKLNDVAYMEEIIDHAIVDWADVKSNGKIVKCTLQNKKKMAIDKNHPGRVERILSRAMIPTTFHPSVEEIVENLIRPSNISENGNEVEATVVG